VGSRHAFEGGGLNLSPASIRNRCCRIWRKLGLLAAPHTSAGGCRPKQGLRLFVDGMMQAAEPTADERAPSNPGCKAAARSKARSPPRPPHSPAFRPAQASCWCPSARRVLRHFSFARLSATQALAIMVGADGSVENRLVEISPSVGDGALAEAGNYISARLSGLTLSEALARLDAEIRGQKAALDTASAELVRKGLALWSLDANDRPVLIVRGQSNLLDETAAADLDRVRQLLDELESTEEIARLIDSAREAQATRIFIGSENNLFSLSGSSVIAAPYRDQEGKIVGVVGVIGPTRLNYARIVPMVDFTAQALSRLMK
jgi:heat-inducible transcriptional repressor